LWLLPDGHADSQDVSCVFPFIQYHAMRYASILLFAALFAFATIRWGVPHQVGVAYLVASVASFVAYAMDKSAARAGRWRTSESTLLLLGLACGWPGAALAQQWLRHKSTKASFRVPFWATVVLNIGAFLYLSSPASFLRPS
jgi:uncharacterized membrane protein YsdA (DUF1294 family)